MQFQTQAASKRAYDAALHPDRLVYEYHMNLAMKPSQCADLDILARQEGGLGALNVGYILER